MLAARRDVAAAIGFDAQRFDGFHLYDADFSLRASAAGCAVSVVSDITVFHRSPGASTPNGTATTRRSSPRTQLELD